MTAEKLEFESAENEIVDAWIGYYDNGYEDDREPPKKEFSLTFLGVPLIGHIYQDSYATKCIDVYVESIESEPFSGLVYPQGDQDDRTNWLLGALLAAGPLIRSVAGSDYFRIARERAVLEATVKGSSRSKTSRI